MLAGRRFFYKQFDPTPKVINSRLSVRHHNTTGGVRPEEKLVPPPDESIVIPPRIERGPTDILKALSSTVGYDPTAHPYKFPDDPYFKVSSFYQKKVCSLSMESGRKSAIWIIKNNPSLFQHKVSEPLIKAFCPKLPTKDEINTEQDLISAIEERDISHAIKIYEALKSKKCDVSQSTKQCLLELVCFYNSSPVPEQHTESKWWEVEDEDLEQSSDWKKEGFAERLFQEMDTECPLAISALIQGKFKFGDTDSALKLFEKARERKMKLSVEVYNLYLRQLYVNPKVNVPPYKKTLEDMAAEGIKPSVDILNSVIFRLLQPRFLLRRKPWAEAVLNEFVRLKIEPTLGTYGQMIHIYGKVFLNAEIGYLSALDDVFKIMDEIEKKDFEIRHIEDLYFFNTVINVVCENFRSIELAKRVVNFYFMKNNAQFIVTAKHEEKLFEKFCLLLFKMNEVESGMAEFRRYVFRKMHPEWKLFLEIFRSLEYNFLPAYLPEIWNAIETLRYTGNTLILRNFLKMVNTFTDEKSLKIFHLAATHIQKSLEKENLGIEDTFSDLLITFAKCKDKKNVVKCLTDFKYKDVMKIKPDALKVVVEFLASVNDFPLVLDLLTLTSDTDKKLASETAKKVAPSFSGEQKVLIERFVIAKDDGKQCSEEKV